MTHMAIESQSLARHIAEADSKLLMSAGLEDRIDMTAYRDAADSSGLAVLGIGVTVVDKHDMALVDGSFVSCSNSVPHPSQKGASCLSVTFTTTPEKALGLLGVVPSIDGFVLTAGNQELKKTFVRIYLSFPTHVLELSDDGRHAIVTLMCG